MNIIKPNGEESQGIFSDPNKFRDLRKRMENKLDELLQFLGNDLRESPVTKAIAEKLIDTYDLRWLAECDIMQRQDFPVQRDAFRKAASGVLDQLARKAMYAGPFTPEALEILGFRKWSDGSWRTHEITLKPIGTDWEVVITQRLIAPYKLPFLLSLTSAAGIKSLTPLPEPVRRGWRTLLAR